MASTTKIPFFGTSKSASKSVSLVEIRRDGNGLIQSHRVCDFRVLEDSKIHQNDFSGKVHRSAANHTYPIQIQKDAQGWQLSRRSRHGTDRLSVTTARRTNCRPKSMTPPCSTGTTMAIRPPHSDFHSAVTQRRALHRAARPIRSHRSYRSSPGELKAISRCRVSRNGFSALDRVSSEVAEDRARPKRESLLSQPDRRRQHL